MVAQCGRDDGCTTFGASVRQRGPDGGPVLVQDPVEGCDNLFALLAEFGLIPRGPYTFTLPGDDSLPQSATGSLGTGVWGQAPNSRG